MLAREIRHAVAAMHQENTGALAGDVRVISEVALQRRVRVLVLHGLSLELRCGRADLEKCRHIQEQQRPTCDEIFSYDPSERK